MPYTYHRYLTDHLPPPSTIPLDVKLTVPERKFACNVVLKPEDSMEMILQKLKALMEKENFIIVEFPACEDFEVSIIRSGRTCKSLKPNPYWGVAYEISGAAVQAFCVYFSAPLLRSVKTRQVLLWQQEEGRKGAVPRMKRAWC